MNLPGFFLLCPTRAEAALFAFIAARIAIP
jgi:hypothetical protein